MTIQENNSQELSELLSLFQGDIVCFLLVNGRYALCERFLDQLVVIRIEDHPMENFHPRDFTSDLKQRGAVLVDHLLPVIGTSWIHKFCEPHRVNFEG